MRIVIMGGSFNPPTVAHLRLMRAAVSAVGAEKGIFVPSSDSYVRNKMKKQGKEAETLPEGIRYGMLLAMTEDIPELTVDEREFSYTEKRYTYDTMASIQEDYPEDTLYFLAGNDKLSVIPRWGRIEEFLARFRIIVSRRDGEDPEKSIAVDPFLNSRREALFIMETPKGLDGVSSTAVRNSLKNKDTGAESMCHPAAWRLLTRYMETVRSLKGEYEFLSNFYESPIEYGGVTYKNNEAAFQAQKCEDVGERRQFEELSPEEAKALGRAVRLRGDWNEVRVSVMEEIVRAKFTQSSDLRNRLLATGDRMIEDGNSRGDTFWGVDKDTRKGENRLGRILMKIREELRKEG